MSLGNTFVAVHLPTEMDADEVAMCCLIEIGIIVDVVEILACFSKLFRSTKTERFTNQWPVCLGKADCMSRLFIFIHSLRRWTRRFTRCSGGS